MSSKRRKEKTASDIKLKHADRSGPTDATLLQFAQERGLFDKADADPRNKNKPASKAPGAEEDADSLLSPTVDRIMEAMLWTVSLAMLHFTLDVLVQNQYGVEIDWPSIIKRAVLAFLLFFFLFYTLHPHSSSPVLVPGLPLRFQSHIRQAIFFFTSISAGCYLIYITNSFGYLAVLKRAPPLGCLWIWAVIELNLGLAVASLGVAGVFLWQGDYGIK